MASSFITTNLSNVNVLYAYNRLSYPHPLTTCCNKSFIHVVGNANNLMRLIKKEQQKSCSS